MSGLKTYARIPRPQAAQKRRLPIPSAAGTWGNVIVVHSLDRLGRATLNMIRDQTECGIGGRILADPSLTDSAKADYPMSLWRRCPDLVH